MNGIHWLEYFKNTYSPHLDRHSSGAKRGLQGTIYNRSQGYEEIFKRLLAQKSKNFCIIETGSTRKPNNWKDGNSGSLFADFVKHHGGFVHSVDIDPLAVQAANDYIDSKYHQAHHSDSVSWLSGRDDLCNVDLFYLDSWDVKWENDQPSAEHHLKEFLIIEPHLKAGCVVAIDDNARLLSGQPTGKGRMIVEYLAAKHIQPVYDDYQIIFQF
jgi:hypothetical protein